MADINKFQHDYRGKKENKNAVESTKGAGHTFTYRPAGKEDRNARRNIWNRYTTMRDSPERKEAEKRWDLGDKMYRMWVPERDPEDWQADIVLPDGFAAVQTHMQETIHLRPRPVLEGVESSDETLENYVNHIYQHAMDKTDFDIESYKARNCSAIRGDAFTLEEYRYETREVSDPIEWKDGEMKYRKREIVDYDDVYTRWVDNWAVFIDDTVDDYKYARDCVYREVLDIDSFKASYEGKAGFNNVSEVVPANSVPKTAGFFKKVADLAGDEVEILHYWNRLTDSYDVLANNVLIRRGPLPSRHKELPIDKWTFYPIPGEIWGMGIPYIIYTLVEERRSGRNIALDRNKMANHKMFLVNDLFDLDEDDMTPRPHGLIKVNTNGLPINQAIQPLEYSDVPGSSIRMDDTLLTEERRAHGLDDRPAQVAGGTATESAIISESAQKRINLINTLQNMTTLKSLGAKKWSNIQFFYPAGRTEEIMEDNKLKKKTVYKTVKISEQEFKVKGDTEKGQGLQLVMAPYPGSSRIALDPTFARFMEGSYDVIVNAQNNVVESPAVKFARLSELSLGLLNNPMTGRYMSGDKTVKRLYQLANENPRDWMPSEGMSEEEMRDLAEMENELIMKMDQTGKVYQLPPTPGALESHTEVHLNFMLTDAYDKLPEPVQQVLIDHVLGEHEKNPNTGPIGEKLAEMGLLEEDEPMIGPDGLPIVDGPPQGGGGNAVPPGMPGGPPVPEMPMGGPVTGGDVTAGNPPLM